MDGNEEGRVRWRPRRAGRASSYLRPFDVKPGEPIVLCCRVSRRVQHRRGNHKDQAAALTAAVNAAGGRVVAAVTECGPGTDPGWLAAAAAQAQWHGARLLAETTDRFIRSSQYHTNYFPDAQAGEHELAYMAFWLDGVEAMTLIHPDATPAEVMSYQRKRGQTEKGRKGGRPAAKEPGYKKERRESERPRVFEMRAVGATVPAIKAETGVPTRTIYNWLAKDRGKAK